jgi:hypothetical protein
MSRVVQSPQAVLRHVRRDGKLHQLMSSVYGEVVESCEKASLEIHRAEHCLNAPPAHQS